jgi:hypothetical protein
VCAKSDGCDDHGGGDEESHATKLARTQAFSRSLTRP